PPPATLVPYTTLFRSAIRRTQRPRSERTGNAPRSSGSRAASPVPPRVDLPAPVHTLSTVRGRMNAIRTGVSALLLFSWSVAPATADAQQRLKDAYQGAFKIGAALGTGIINQTDTAGVRLVKEHFNSITAENVLKPQPINPQPGVYNFDPADRYVEFGEANGMFIVGH